MSDKQCRLCLHEGSSLCIKSINSSHPSARKLKAMGFGEGCNITIERVSPFGDPCMVKLRGYSLAVRRKDFGAIDVEEDLIKAEV